MGNARWLGEMFDQSVLFFISQYDAPPIFTISNTSNTKFLLGGLICTQTSIEGLKPPIYIIPQCTSTFCHPEIWKCGCWMADSGPWMLWNGCVCWMQWNYACRVVFGCTDTFSDRLNLILCRRHQIRSTEACWWTLALWRRWNSVAGSVLYFTMLICYRKTIEMFIRVPKCRVTCQLL